MPNARHFVSSSFSHHLGSSSHPDEDDEDEGTGNSLKDKNEAKPNKTEHEIGKSTKNRGQRYKRIENRAKTDISGSNRQRLCI
ncbi:hypothetical protein Tco_0597297 [Tanacetum coccineum]